MFVLGACAEANTAGEGSPSGADAGDDPPVREADAGPGAGIDASTPGGAADAAPGVPQSITITASASDQIIEGNSVGCMSTTGESVHLANSYFRVFDLPSFGVSSSFAISKVDIGIELATAASTGSQPAEVRLHTLTGPLQMANLTPLASTSTSIPDMTLATHSVALSATAPAGATLVVELHTPDGTTAQNIVMVGSNSAAESSPTYIMADDCSLSEPESTSGSAIGRPEMHWVLSVTGTHTP